MHYAIIAAGDGSRLVSDGVFVPKPLVPINGVPMIGRLLGIFARNKAESISVIVNPGMSEVKTFLDIWSDSAHLQSLGIPRFSLISEATPSSMHSLYCLSKVIDAGTVCVTTVDTIFREEQFAEFIAHAEYLECHDGCFAVTPFVDDEKPLYVETDGSRIVGFHDDGHYPFVSGGIYCLKTAKAFPVLSQCIRDGVFRMRNFQRALIDAGLDIEPWVFPKIMDVDHAADIVKAEAFLRQRILFVSRAHEYSPCNIDPDFTILQLTLDKCMSLAPETEVSMVGEHELSAAIVGQFSLVAGMCRCPESLSMIADSGIVSVNSPKGISLISTSRTLTMTALQAVGLLVPPFCSFDSVSGQHFSQHPHAMSLLPGWVKVMRLDGRHHDDVRYVSNLADADSAIDDFISQKVSDIVVTRHLHGDLLKAYAVVDSKGCVQLLRWFYPKEHDYGCFGHEMHNDALSRHYFDKQDLHSMIVTIATTLGLKVFGVDIIVDSEGNMYIIDVNDWPSFSVCQHEASEAIARTILLDLET